MSEPLLSDILVRHGTLWVAGMVAVAAAGLAVTGIDHALAVGAAGTLAGVSFVGLVFIVGRLLDSRTPAGSKAGLTGMLIAKMGIVAGGFYYLIVEMGISPLGTSFGIGAAILGLTIGLNRGTASPEGQAAMDAESQRIAEQMREESESDSKE
jgi:hypothetical protein